VTRAVECEVAFEGFDGAEISAFSGLGEGVACFVEALHVAIVVNVVVKVHGLLINGWLQGIVGIGKWGEQVVATFIAWNGVESGGLFAMFTGVGRVYSEEGEAGGGGEGASFDEFTAGGSLCTLHESDG